MSISVSCTAGTIYIQLIQLALTAPQLRPASGVRYQELARLEVDEA